MVSTAESAAKYSSVRCLSKPIGIGMGQSPQVPLQKNNFCQYPFITTEQKLRPWSTYQIAATQLHLSATEMNNPNFYPRLSLEAHYLF